MRKLDAEPRLNGVSSTVMEWARLVAQVVNAGIDLLTTISGYFVAGVLGIANGGTGASTVLGARANLGIANLGQCEVILSGGNFVLLPRDGNLICISGVMRQVPAAGVSLAPTGTAATTIYYLYASWNGTAVVLERDTTGHALDANYGMRVKSTDAARTLVGMTRTAAAGAWVNSQTQRFLLNWFNPRLQQVSVTLGSTLTTNLTTPQFLAQVEFLSWGNTAISASIAGGMQNNTAAAVNFVAIGIDSTTVAATPSSFGQAYVNNGYSSFTTTFPVTVAAEGYHSLVALGWVNSGTGSFLAGSGLGAAILV
jgi:hypothetical protein